jgi:UDP-2,3-diacylglucosamine pyrophosphatase LpxH
MAKMKFKTVWISDVHLGSQGCQANELIDFLDSVKFDTLILNGDIIDGWRLKSKWFFPQEHVNAIRKVLSLAKKDKEIIYVTGNHDEFLRSYHDFDLKMGNITILNKLEYESVSGKQFLVVHGDAFDNIVKYHKWVAVIGDLGYNFLIRVNRLVNKIRKSLGREYWSISKYIKYKVKKAANFIFAFEETAATAAQRRFDGIICGHIHHPELKVFDNGVIYINSGDWVETCSWIGETEDGIFEVWEWNQGKPVLIERLRV